MNGGTLESSGTFSRSFGTGAGQIQWTGTSAAGFAASTAPLTVNLNGGTQILWGSTTGFSSTGALVFGSATALDVVTFANPIAINGATRTVTVTANALTAMLTDSSVMTGVFPTRPRTGEDKKKAPVCHYTKGE